MSNAYYGPHLPSPAFDLFVVKHAKFCECLTRFNKLHQKLQVSFHKEVDPDKFAELLRETWAELDNTHRVGNGPSTLSVTDQHTSPLLSEHSGDRVIHFYRREV